MIHDLSIMLNEQTLPFLPAGDPHMVWTHRADHAFAPCQVSLAVLVTHLGTHVDAPLHFIPGGKTTAQMDLACYCGQAACIAAEGFPREGVYDLAQDLEKNASLVAGADILIVSTGYEKLVGTPEYFRSPDFGENTGALLEDLGIRGIGIDAPTIGQQNRAHQEILGRDIGIIESLVNLGPLVGRRFYFSAVPLKFEDGDGSPVRAYAVT
ncbi:MAG: cyclase family protein [Clostridiales Family XIII bacterium]|jgi:kynurenine formamidase|nr:cyclase family protein [Clostridiales Family XIII bacterium]